MNFEDQLSFYPYGTQYHRAPTPLPQEWAGDLAEIARCGYTHVQFRPQWRWHERVRGQRVWSDLDQLFDLAAANKLRVVLKPFLETAPDWVFADLGGTRIGFHGTPIEPFAHGACYVGGWWPCFDNPAVRAAAGDFACEMIHRYHTHPALWFYDAWNEPRSWPMGQCHCSHSQASYRQWLRERFGTVEKLNEFLGKAWTSFDLIRAPEGADDFAEMFLWRQWCAWTVGDKVGLVAKAIRSQDPKAFVMVHVGGSNIIQDTGQDIGDDFQVAARTDRFGTSMGVSLHPRTPMEIAGGDLQSDWVRRVDPSYWCHEFYPNHGMWSPPPQPATLRRLVWLAIAGGASGFTYWQYRSERVGNESNGFGMREIDGSPTLRSRVTDEIAAVIRKHGKALVGARRIASDVAILYDRPSDMILRIQEMKTWSQDLMDEPCHWSAHKKAVHAAHAMYLHSGHTVDWVVPGDDLAGRRLLHVSAMEMVDEAAAQWLRQYVRGGGTLIVEMPFACRDANTWVSMRRPKHGLEDLLGCRERERVCTDAMSPLPVAKFETGGELEASRWRTTLEPQGGKIIARWADGSAAAVENVYGKGKVLCLGANLTLACWAKWDAAKLGIFEGLLGRAGVPCDTQSPWVRRRRGPDGEVWFVLNVYDHVATLQLPAAPKEVWVSPDGSLQGLRLTLPPGETWVAQMPLCPG
jgi:beta-galactosidase GanA